MFRVGKWLEKGTGASPSASTTSLDIVSESQSLQDALKAADKIMNDDIAGATKDLAQGNSVYHKLGRGILGFMKSTLGFEHDVIKEAADQLYEAEVGAAQNLARAQHDSRAYRSEIYDKGAEFALCQAEAQLMAAVVGVLNESLTEAIKGFYKARKAYMTLDGLVQMETAFMKSRGLKSLMNSRQHSSESLRSAKSITSTKAKAAEAAAAPPYTPSSLKETTGTAGDVSDDEDEFYDADADHDHEKSTTAKEYSGRYSAHSETASLEKKIEELSTGGASPPMSPPRPSIVETSKMINDDADSELFLNPLDEFVHSGINTCFGMLLLMISIIPPAFSKLLYIIGFRGDREQGLKMLWQAAKFKNVNGAIAGAVLFGWYSGMSGFCDIIADGNPEDPDDVQGYPGARLRAMLMDLRQRYPNSYLWIIEEARMAASHKKPNESIELLSGEGQSQLKQLEALRAFQKGLNSMDAHKYKLCADTFLLCVDLNAWSQALYYYIAGASHLAAYRHAKDGFEVQHKKLAEEYFKTAPTKVGKKKMMGRQLPFDLFVVRKITKWEARAAARNCSFIDAIGVSPLEEMDLLWNGHKRMDRENLLLSLECLKWSEDQPGWAQEPVDEKAILALLKAVILRNFKEHEKAIAIITNEILVHDPSNFRGENRDDWAQPTAHFEVAANYWMMRKDYLRQPQRGSLDPTPADVKPSIPARDVPGDTKLVQKCKQHVEKAKNWGKYELEARIGLKIAAANDAIQKWEQKNLRA